MAEHQVYRKVNGKMILTFPKPVLKMIDGKEYTLHSSHQSKRDAYASAKIKREMGKSARIEPEYYMGLRAWNVWVK
jgi:hypothetical protein